MGRSCARSNPLRIVAEAELLPYWCDLHGQSEETIGTNSARELIEFARDRAFLDGMSHQGNDFQITDAVLERAQRADARIQPATAGSSSSRATNGPAIPALGGDRNVMFHARGAADPPLLACAGGRSDRRGDRCQQCRRPVPAPCKTRIASSSPISAGATRTSRWRMTCRSSARWRCTRTGALSNGWSRMRWSRAIGSALPPTPTAIKDARAQAIRARRCSAPMAG